MPQLRGLLTNVPPGKAVQVIAGAVVALAVGVLAGHFLWGVEREVVKTKLLPPDTPPAEYLYLDSDRVLAYLGQIEGGLTEREKRTESRTAEETATLKGGLLAEIGGSARVESSVETLVTPAATDRFFSLLIKLRSGRKDGTGGNDRWLHNLDARVSRRNSIKRVLKELERTEEGDFLRISNARLRLPRFAALVPRARGVAAYANSETLVAPKNRADVDVYLKRLGADPVVPFRIAAWSSAGSLGQLLTFFVPARYTRLIDNARLLSSELTIVGKVVYKDPSLTEDRGCPDGSEVRPPECQYVDGETIATFGQALAKAPQSVLASLHVRRTRASEAVRASSTFAMPLVVVIPIAIYQ